MADETVEARMIHDLTLDNKRLREALEEIAAPVYAEGKKSGYPCPHHEIARSALSSPDSEEA